MSPPPAPRAPVRRAALLLVGALGVLAAPAAAGERVLTPRDAISTPGRPVELSAKLERRLGPLRPDQGQAELEFRYGEQVALARTDSDGVARAQVTPVGSGVQAFRVVWRGSPELSAQGRLWVVSPERPVLVSDIDGTLSDLPGYQVPFRGGSAPAFADAAPLLRELAQTHAIVYLSARDESFRADSRAFLSRQEFPPGPLLLNSWGLDRGEQRAQLLPSRHGEFKLRTLRELQGRGLRLTIGLGDQATDAEAYEAAGLRSLIRGSDTSIGARSVVFPDYAALRRRFVREGLLTATAPPRAD